MYLSDVPSAIETNAAQQAARFRALADETRLQILQLLRGGEQCVCELTDALELSQPLLSFHLKALREAGLVRHRKDGRWTYYAIELEAVRDLERVVGGLAEPAKRSSRRSGRCD